MKAQWDYDKVELEVRSWKARTGRTLKSLALEIGMRPQSLANALNGQNALSEKSAEALAGVIGCRVEDFVKNAHPHSFAHINEKILLGILTYVEIALLRKRSRLRPDVYARLIYNLYNLALDSQIQAETKSGQELIEKIVQSSLTPEILCETYTKRPSS